MSTLYQHIVTTTLIVALTIFVFIFVALYVYSDLIDRNKRKLTELEQRPEQEALEQRSREQEMSFVRHMAELGYEQRVESSVASERYDYGSLVSRLYIDHLVWYKIKDEDLDEEVDDEECDYE